MRVLLDTVAFIMAAQSPERLSPKAQRVLENPRNIKELSVISLTEIATKSATGKLLFNKEDVFQAASDLQLKFINFTTDHAIEMFQLPLHHRDPFDRQIIAQALAENVPVVTSDESFHLYRGLSVIW
jgi:PIN domain nuclease of toxin-antitoxin system